MSSSRSSSSSSSGSGSASRDHSRHSHDERTAPLSPPPRKRIRSDDSPRDGHDGGHDGGHEWEVKPGGPMTSLDAAEAEARAKAAARASMATMQAARQAVSNGDDGDEEPGDHSASHPPPSPAMPPRSAHPGIVQCSPVSDYERLNHIEEGSYGVVFRARHRRSGEIVALKRLKLDCERNGFPITSLREIRTLMLARHRNVVRVREVAVGSTLTQIFIVFEFVEHDLKTLLSAVRAPFLLSEVKSLVRQLLEAVALLHSRWIVHRDLKTSNLLLNNRGCLKLADFGLARLYGEGGGRHDSDSGSNAAHPAHMTELVVTLWYRSPELLLGASSYDTAVDMWSVGCILGELLTGTPLLPGKNESDQLLRIFALLGQPSLSSWPGLARLPLARKMQLHRPAGPSPPLAQPYSALRSACGSARGAGLPLSDAGLDLLARLLAYDPARRIRADEALRHAWFEESPRPAHPESFGSFPSIAAGERRAVREDSPEVGGVGGVGGAAGTGAGAARGRGKKYELELGF